MVTEKVDLSVAEVVPSLPNYRYGDITTEPLPTGIIGSRIIQMGIEVPSKLRDWGAFIIDYLPDGSADVIRAVIGWGEFGLWVESTTKMGSSPK